MAYRLYPFSVGQGLPPLPFRSPMVVGDVNTLAACPVEGPCRMVLEKGVKADVVTAQRIVREAQGTDVLIAVGSGTVNDLVKYASFTMGIPYICVPTAPSMNGYVSPTASLTTVEGHKTSLPAHQPVAVWVDKQVLAAAPWELIAAGVGDALCRTTVQTDWLLAHWLRGTPYDAALFDGMMEIEQLVLAQAEALKLRDEEAIARLFSLLLLGGQAMASMGSSHPASQGEHMIAHLMEMSAHAPEPSVETYQKVYHGQEIAVTALTMAQIQEEMLVQPVPVLCYRAPDKQGLVALVGEVMAETLLKAYAAKGLTEEAVEGINSKLVKIWPQLQRWHATYGVSAAVLRALYTRLGLPVEPYAVGWDKGRYAQAAALACLTRDRFTFLDVAYFA